MRHRLVGWVPIAFAVALGATSCASDDPPTDTYELSGYILDDLNDRAVGGARVTFTSDTLYSESTTADEDGLYEMLVETDVPFGQVRAERDGYEPREVTVFFDSPIRRIDIRLKRSL